MGRRRRTRLPPPGARGHLEEPRPVLGGPPSLEQSQLRRGGARRHDSRYLVRDPIVSWPDRPLDLSVGGSRPQPRSHRGARCRTHLFQRQLDSGDGEALSPVSPPGPPSRRSPGWRAGAPLAARLAANPRRRPARPRLPLAPILAVLAAHPPGPHRAFAPARRRLGGPAQGAPRRRRPRGFRGVARAGARAAPRTIARPGFSGMGLALLGHPGRGAPDLSKSLPRLAGRSGSHARLSALRRIGGACPKPKPASPSGAWPPWPTPTRTPRPRCSANPAGPRCGPSSNPQSMAGISWAPGAGS